MALSKAAGVINSVHLQHTAKVVWPVGVTCGRTFLRRIFCAASADVTIPSGWMLNFTWIFSGGTSFCQPGMAWASGCSLTCNAAASDLEVTSDAPGSFGFGDFLKGEWFSRAWVPCQFEQSIAYKEIFTVVIAARVWGLQWFRQHFRVFFSLPLIW